MFCRDVGWRKPASPIFQVTLERLQVRPEQCLFVGDEPRWDIAGPAAVGISAVLLDRRAAMQDLEVPRIESLWQLLDYLKGRNADSYRNLIERLGLRK